MAQPGLIPQTVDYSLAGKAYLGDKTVCVYDNGLYTSLAGCLAKSFGQVLYHSPWIQAFPRSNAMTVGSGIPGVTWINSIWPYIDQIDLFVFPDIFQGQLQVYLRSLGKRVWGSALAQALEIERPESKVWLKKMGLPVGAYAILKGTAALRKHLQVHDDQHVKIAKTRGDMETFHALTYDLIEPRLDELEFALGARKSEVEFVAEDHIKAKIEIGYDGFTIDGKYPKSSLFGVETKDNGYVGQVRVVELLPKQINYVNTKLAPLFKDLKYRGWWSSELRIAEDGTPYLIDPCCRMPSPPGELYQYLIENLAQIIWMGAAGALIEPVWKHEWGALLVLKSDWANHGWQPIEFPPELNDQVKLHYQTVLNGKNYFVPQNISFPEIGAVVAGGATQQQAIDAVLTAVKEVKGYDIQYDIAALGKAAEGMGKVAKAMVN